MHARRQPDRSGTTESRRRFRKCFADRERVFLPVIYTSNEKQALLTVETAREAKADGVFLTSHGIGHSVLLEITRKVIALHPRFFVAVNCLDLNTLQLIDRLPPGVNGVWINEPPTLAGIQNVATAVREGRPASRWDGLLFATVATG